MPGAVDGAVLMDESLNHDEWLTVADAARLLMVSRNDMPLIPGRRQLWQTWCYKRSDITKWATRDLASPTSILRRLREKKAAAVQKQAKRRNPYTKTGRTKKTFRLTGLTNRPFLLTALIACPKCGVDLEIENRPKGFLGDEGLKKLLDRIGCTSIDLNVQQKELVKHEKILSRLVNDDNLPNNKYRKVEDELEDVERYLDQVKTLVWLYSESLIVRCPKCDQRFCKSRSADDDNDEGYEDDDHLAWSELDVKRNRKPLVQPDDDVRAMTTSTFSIETGGLAGDIPDEGSSDDES